MATNKRKSKKKKVSYAFPIVLSVCSIILFNAYRTSDAWTRILVLYIGITIFAPLSLTYITNLLMAMVIPSKKQNKKKAKA